jgi:hypothetical protein
VSPDGSRVFVTGAIQATRELLSDDYATVAYDAGSGAQLWERRYFGSGSSLASGDDQAYAVAVSPDGLKVFVTGASAPARSDCGEHCQPPHDYATVAYDAEAGLELWVSLYTGPSLPNREDTAISIAMSPGGDRVFVTGTSWGIGDDYATVAYSTR